MLKFKKKNIGTILTFFISITICIFLFLELGIFEKTIFISDLNAEYRPLLMKLGNGADSYYFNTGLGDSFLGTFYYYMSSPLNILSLFIKDINLLVIILVILKLSLASVTAYLFFRYQFKEEKKTLLIPISLLYAFSSFAISYYLHIMWLDIYLLFPLVLLGIDKMLKENKHLLYIISLFLTIYCNYYFAYMICIFAFIYFNYKLLIKTNNKKEILKTNIHFIIVSILSCLVASITLIPVAAELSSYSRQNGSLFGGEELNFNFNISKFVNNVLIGNFDDIEFLNESSFFIYTSIIVIPLFYFYYINKKISLKEKILSSIILLILILSISCNYLNYFWHGFVPPSFFNGRYTFMFILFMLLISLKGIYDIDDYKIYHYIIPLLIVLVPFIFFGKKDGLAILRIVLLIFYLIILKTSFKFNTNALLIFFVVYEILINGTIYLKNYGFCSKDNGNEFESAIKYIKEKDDNKFYRIEDNNSKSDNYPMLYDYNGVDYFMSTVKKDVVNFFINMDLGNHDYTKNTISYDGSYFLQSSLLDIKYYIETKNKENPMYDFYNKTDNYTIYQNPYSLNLGYMVNDNILNTKINSNGLENIKNIYKDMSGIEVLDEIKLDKIDDYNYKFKNKKDDNFYVLVKFKNWYSYDSLKLYINDIQATNTEGTYMYHIINDNDEYINIRLDINSSDIPDIEGVYAYYYNVDKFEDSINLLKKNQLNVEKTKNSTLTGTIDVDNSNILFISIPYDKDLHIYVDGKEVEELKLLDTFLGIKLDKGKHDIKIKYIPKTLYLSFIPSIISSILLYLYLKRRKKALN